MSKLFSFSKLVISLALTAIIFPYMDAGAQDDLQNKKNVEKITEKITIEEKFREIYFQKGSFELGGAFGNPSGINYRYWITNKIGLDGALGFYFNNDPVATLDFVIEEFQFYNTSSFDIRFYYGIGGLLARQEDEYKNNLRAPIGLSFPLKKYPLNISFYIAPAMAFKPDREFELNWGLGVRYNFGKYTVQEKERGRMKIEIGNLEGSVKELEGALNSAKGKLEETEGRLNKTKGTLDETRGKLESVKERLNKTESELGKTKLSLFQKSEELDDAKYQLDDVKKDLEKTKKTLDDKYAELEKKQTDLTKAKNIIENALTGEEKEQEAKKLALEQKKIDDKRQQFEKEKIDWERIRKKEAESRDQLREECESRGGIINKDGYCTCPENEEWDLKTNTCVCLKGYKRNSKDGECKPCEIISYDGECSDDCRDDEKKAQLKKSPHKYVCVKKCRDVNEVWSKKKQSCVCKDGFYKEASGKCVPRT